MKATLRPATAADAARVAEIFIATRTRFMPYAPAAHSDAEIREWVATELVPEGGVTVAVRVTQVMAAMATRVSEGLSWILQLHVDPAFVGQGMGTQLLADALRTLPRPIRLYTFQPNTGARRFYERHGFVAIEFTDGQGNEERCPGVLYEWRGT